MMPTYMSISRWSSQKLNSYWYKKMEELSHIVIGKVWPGANHSRSQTADTHVPTQAKVEE